MKSPHKPPPNLNDWCCNVRHYHLQVRRWRSTNVLQLNNKGSLYPAVVEFGKTRFGHTSSSHTLFRRFDTEHTYPPLDRWQSHGTYGEVERHILHQWGRSVRTFNRLGVVTPEWCYWAPQFCCHVLCQIRAIHFASPVAGPGTAPENLASAVSWELPPYIWLVKSSVTMKSSGSRLTIKSLTSLRRSCTMLREKWGSCRTFLTLTGDLYVGFDLNVSNRNFLSMVVLGWHLSPGKNNRVAAETVVRLEHL